MAIVKRCDRCKAIYEKNTNKLSQDETIDPIIVNVGTQNDNGTYDLYMDLCDDCMTKLYKFLVGKGTEEDAEAKPEDVTERTYNQFKELLCGDGFEADYVESFDSQAHMAANYVLDILLPNGDTVLADLSGGCHVHEYYDGLEDFLLERLAKVLLTTIYDLKEHINSRNVSVVTYADNVITSKSKRSIRIWVDNRCSAIIYIPGEKEE